jgi:hypothetical protein
LTTALVALACALKCAPHQFAAAGVNPHLAHNVAARLGDAFLPA